MLHDKLVENLYSYLKENKISLNEELNKSDEKEIKSLIKKELDDYKNDIKEMIKKELKGKVAEDIIIDTIQKAFVQFYKTIWERRGFWLGSLKK